MASIDPYELTQSGDFYQLLQVGRNATSEEIKKAYRAQSRRFHPDKTLDTKSEEVMKKLNEAKSVLLDEIKRAEYDDNLDEHGALCDPKGFLLSGIAILLANIHSTKSKRVSM